jgi:outer membrane protein OmpA-like peptidoglycan-associated protein
LTVADKANLNSVIGLILPGAEVIIKGYASAGGSAAYNLALSQSRANSVKQYVLAALAVKHVAARSVTATGYGVSPLGRAAVITKL